MNPQESRRYQPANVVIVLAVLASIACLGFTTTKAQTCAARPGEDLQWGAPGDSKVYLRVVPSGEAWIVRAAGVFGGAGAGPSGNGFEYMLEIIHPLAGYDDSAFVESAQACCWRIPIARTPGLANGTPLLALPRTVIVLPGERLAARANSLPSDAKFGLTAVFWRVPDTCVGVAGAW
jgi:hypothetical protein